MKNKIAIKRYKDAKQLANDFEYQLLQNQVFATNICDLFAKRLKLETTPSISKIRQILQSRCKYWKTICRYPLSKDEILLLGFRKNVQTTFTVKFPIKVKVCTWAVNNVNQLMVNPIGGQAKVFFQLKDFQTGNCFYNKIYKNLEVSI